MADDTVERLHASAAETRAKVAIVQSDPMIYPPLLDEMLRSAAKVDGAADLIDRQRAEIGRLREALKGVIDLASFRAESLARSDNPDIVAYGESYRLSVQEARTALSGTTREK